MRRTRGARRMPGTAGIVCLLVVAAGCQCGDPVSPPEQPEEKQAPAEDPKASVPPRTFPGTAQLDPDKAVLPCFDDDGDGFGFGAGCAGLDCDDTDASIGGEGSIRSCYSGPAGTAGVGLCSAGTQTCLSGSWTECTGEIHPDAESCDGLDNNCDGSVDEGLFQACYPGPEGTEGVGACMGGTSTCVAGTWEACAGYTVPAAEFCDGSDNDCNGRSDENLSRYTQNGTDQAVEPAYQPVDVILVIDNSGSMADEIRSVENNINTHFAELIGRSGLDYRVILLSAHGTGGNVCIRSPLSGNGDCSTPAPCPVNGPRFFHYNVPIGSHDSFSKIVGTWGAPDSCGLAPNGWSGWLRPEATKVFIEFTDDQPFSNKTGPNGWTAAQFETALFSLSTTHFGTDTARNYVFHSIVGLKENAPATDPWLPSDPLVSSLCTGNGGAVRTAGTEFQKVSIASGGLRYPICEYQDFDAIFETVATGIVIGNQLVCRFTLSSIPADSSLGNAWLELKPTGSGMAQIVPQVSGEAACSGSAFYTDNDQIVLCPDACQAWRQDPTASIDVVFSCSNQVQP